MTFCGRIDRPEESPSTFWITLGSKRIPIKASLKAPIYLQLDPYQDDLDLQVAEESTACMTLLIQNLHEDRIEGTLFLSVPAKQEIPISWNLDPSARQTGWDLTGHPVDSRLLMKMEMRWFGADLLAAELSEGNPPQHIQFGFGPRAYAFCLAPGETLSFVEGRWVRGVRKGEAIMRCESVDAQKMSLTLWDVSGFHRSELTLSKAYSPPENYVWAQQLRLRGLRGQNRATVCLGTNTYCCKKGDWIVKQGDSWQLLATKEGKQRWLRDRPMGEAFLIHEIHKQRGKPKVLTKTFSASHTDSGTLELIPTPIVASSTSSLGPR